MMDEQNKARLKAELFKLYEQFIPPYVEKYTQDLKDELTSTEESIQEQTQVLNELCDQITTQQRSNQNGPALTPTPSTQIRSETPSTTSKQKIDDLNVTIRTLQETIFDIVTQLTTLENENEHNEQVFLKQLNEAHSKIQQLEVAIKELEIDNAYILKQNDLLQSELQQQINNHDHHRKASELKQKDYIEIQEKTKQDYMNKDKLIQELEAENKKLKQQIISLDLETNNNALTEALEEIEDMKKNLEKTTLKGLESLQTQNAELEKDLEKTRAALKDLHTTTDAEYLQLQAKNSQLRAEKLLLQQDNSTHSVDIQEYTKKLKEQSKELNSLTAVISEDAGKKNILEAENLELRRWIWLIFNGLVTNTEGQRIKAVAAGTKNFKALARTEFWKRHVEPLTLDAKTGKMVEHEDVKLSIL